MLANMEQYGHEGLDVRGITIHNTGLESSAKRIFRQMENSVSDRGCHFLVDEKDVIQVLPLDWCAYHTGKGDDWGNNHTIAIEICRSMCDTELYLTAQRNAVNLIGKLMEEYGIGFDDIYFHSDFNPKKRCPHRILELYGDKNTFVKEILYDNLCNGR